MLLYCCNCYMLLLQKRIVYETVKSPDGYRKQKVDIYYHFIGKID